MTEKGALKVTPSTGNVFRDLGFSKEESEHLLVRADLLIQLQKAITSRGLKQAEAAKVLRVTQPRVSDLLRGRIDLFSTDALIDMLARLGIGVRLVVKAPRSRRWHEATAAIARGRSLSRRSLTQVREYPAVDTHMTKPDISGIAPFFIVKNVPAALSFYRDRLGFDITFQGPDPEDIFFGIVQRGASMIMLKDIGVEPQPNYKRDVNKGSARWDAYLHVSDPDALAAEFSSRNVEFSQPLKDDDDGLRGFELKDADGYVLFFGRPRS